MKEVLNEEMNALEKSPISNRTSSGVQTSQNNLKQLKEHKLYLTLAVQKKVKELTKLTIESSL